MKKILSVVVLLVISVATYAQKDVTKFLGIPVDGYKTEMIQKLKAKGFTVHPLDNNVLQGEFNGRDVNLHIGTNNNKVYRIMLCDKRCLNEADIKIRFNRLCEQFECNSNYVTVEDYTIPEDEKISYEMLVNKKRYEADFYQYPDTIALIQDHKSLISQKYTQEELDNPTEEILSEIQRISKQYFFDRLEKKTVWFTIVENEEGEYYIAMYYDNKYNEANGEDL
ncbi:MAG: hypothetical protein IKW05_06040 [Muribaculaceae bacterium]|nr:hypothetical protein [Clostridia bacterium]MBR5241478.1 hypothetical protein [Muribaculaceae bacterium]